MRLDLVNDTAEIFGKEICLDSTTSGQYCIPLQDMRNSKEECMENQVAVPNIAMIMNRIHKQFGHPTWFKMKALLQVHKCGRKSVKTFSDIIEKLYGSCEICLKFSRTPRKPVVSVSLAKSFNEVVAMDLKEWRKDYILYLIDVFSSFSRWTRNKSPSVSIENVLLIWMGGCWLWFTKHVYNLRWWGICEQRLYGIV